MDDVLQHGIELGRSFIQPRYWGVAGWTTCGPASALIWRAIRTIAICLVRCRFLADCRPPPAICWWHSTGCGSRRRIRWRSRVDLIRRRCPTCWRSLAGGLQRRPGPAEVPARQPRLRDPPLYKQYSEVCEPGGVQFIDFGSDPDFNNCVDGLVLVDLTYLKANRYQRYIGAHLGAQKSA